MFTVNDMYLAAFLMARGHAVHVVRAPGGVSGTRCQFRFPLTAEPDVAGFDDQAISAAGFADSLKRLKSLMARAPLTTQPTGSAR